MATVPVSQLSQQDKAFLACSYALMIVHDEQLECNAQKLTDLIHAANVKIPEFYMKFFADNMSGLNLSDLMKGAGGSVEQEQKGGEKVEEKEEEQVEEIKPVAPAEIINAGGLFPSSSSEEDSDTSSSEEESDD